MSGAGASGSARFRVVGGRGGRWLAGALALVLVALLSGACTEVFSIGCAFSMQYNIDELMLSRASSYYSLGSFVAMPVGQIVYGPLGDAFGLRPVMLASGVVYLLVVALVLSSRSVRELRRAPVDERVGGSHRPDGVRARRADADGEEVERAERHDVSPRARRRRPRRRAGCAASG